MEAFLAVIGGIFVLCIVLFILTVTLIALTDKIKLVFANMNYNASKIARQELGQRIAVDSYWFSENKEVMLAMRSLGQTINQHHDGIYSINKVRDQWLEQIEEFKNV